MEIRIGILNAPRELSFETATSAEAVTATVTEALQGGAGHITLTDAKGSVYLIPTANLAYLEIGSEESRRIGFAG